MTTMSSEYQLPENVTLLPQTAQLLTLLTILRDRETSAVEFARNAERVARVLVSEALNYVPTEQIEVQTPTGSTYRGVRPKRGVCGISILRAGASLENALRNCWSGSLSFGKILIQRDESTALPTHLYSKYPSNLSSKTILILEPMLATGGSASLAIDLLLGQDGVDIRDVVFVNFVASRHGIKVLTDRFPGLNIVCAAIDEHLNETSHIVPGLGDFGDRFYGTDE